MIIKNTTVLSSEESIQEIVEVGRKIYCKKFIFSGILAILGIIIVAIVLGQNNSSDGALIGYLFLAFSFVLTIMNIYNILTITKKTKKKNPRIVEHGMTNIFVFKEESFTLQVKIGDSTAKLEYPYQGLKKIIEYDDKIRFVISDNDVYTCKKDAFQTPKELEVFFYGLAKHKTKIKNKTTKKVQKKAQN